jgi:GNAT superfamily N-acetyltransferase
MSPDDFQFLELSGAEIIPYLDEIAKLRISVFREFPYLYDGSVEYEQKYLQSYCESQESLVVLLKYRNQVIGATTGLPLLDSDEEFQKPLRNSGYDYDIGQVFYFGESVLLPEYRGLGYGHSFFDSRESHAKKKGYSIVCFCAVNREDTHELRPKNYRPHDDFWKKRGFAKHSTIVAEFDWKEVPDGVYRKNKLIFWLKSIEC